MARVKELTGGRGVDVVYDSVGKDTFPGSLDCLKPFGLWATFGNASGPVPPFEIGILAQKGSLYATRPTLVTHIATREGLLETANDLIDMVSLGRVKIQVSKTYPMAEAAEAHRDLESRATTGSIVLLADYAQSLPSAHGGGPDGGLGVSPSPWPSPARGEGAVATAFLLPKLASASLQPGMPASASGCRTGEGWDEGATTVNRCLPHKRRLRWTPVREASIAGAAIAYKRSMKGAGQLRDATRASFYVLETRMLDLKWIRENPKDFDAGLARRGLPPMSAEVLKLDEERRAHTKSLQDMQARRNAASKEIGKAKGKGGDPAKAEALMAEVAGLKDKIAAGEQRERELDEQMKTLLSGIPNMLAPDVPDGKDETENVELRRWGTPRDFKKEGFEPKQHFEIGEALGLMDFEAAAKISGARFTVLKGGLARLERALGQFMLDVQTGEHGYTEVNPPLLVKDDAVFGTAQLPKFARRSYFRHTAKAAGDYLTCY